MAGPPAARRGGDTWEPRSGVSGAAPGSAEPRPPGGLPWATPGNRGLPGPTGQRRGPPPAPRPRPPSSSAPAAPPAPGRDHRPSRPAPDAPRPHAPHRPAWGLYAADRPNSGPGSLSRGRRGVTPEKRRRPRPDARTWSAEPGATRLGAGCGGVQTSALPSRKAWLPAAGSGPHSRRAGAPSSTGGGRGRSCLFKFEIPRRRQFSRSPRSPTYYPQFPVPSPSLSLSGTQDAEGEEGEGEEGGPGPRRREEAGGQEGGQPAVREAAQELRHRSGHPAQAGPDALRQVAALHPAAAAARDPLQAAEGAARHQPVHAGAGPPDGHAAAEAGAQVPARDEAGEEAAAAGPGGEESGRQGGRPDQAAPGAASRGEHGHHAGGEQEGAAGRHRARRGPHRAGGVPARPVSQDGGSLLHHQGEGPVGASGPQEDLHHGGFHAGQLGRQGGSGEAGGSHQDQLQRPVRRDPPPLGRQRPGSEVGGSHRQAGEGKG